MKRFQELKGDYAKIPNALLRDKDLSWKAKGLYCWMASNKDSFHFTVGSIANQYPDGRIAVANAMNELKDSGWLIYTKKANGFSKYYLVADLDDPKSENMIMDQEPKAENMHLEQEAQIPSEDTNNIPKSENTTMAQTQVTPPESENMHLDQKPKAQNPNAENLTMRKHACINKTNSLNKTNLYKGQRDFAEEGKQKSKQESIDNLSARWTVNEVVNQYQ